VVYFDILGKFSRIIEIKFEFSTSAYPQMDEQLKRVIQILDDTLRACVLDFGNEWIESLPYAKLAYYNSY
jgi:hypothetical protein